MWVETVSSLEEVEAVVASSCSASELPIAVAMSFDTAGHTMMGAHLKRMADAGIEIIDDFCGTATEHVAFMRGVIDGVIDPQSSKPLCQLTSQLASHECTLPAGDSAGPKLALCSKSATVPLAMLS